MTTNYNIKDIAPDTYFNSNLVLDSTFLLCTPTYPITQELITALKNWNFTQVQSDGNQGALKSTREEILKKQEQVQSQTVDVNAQEEKKENNAIIEAINRINERFPDTSENSIMKKCASIMNLFSNYILKVFTRFATHRELDMDEMTSTVNQLCHFLKQYSSYVLRLPPSLDSLSNDYLVSHTIRCTTYALVIGDKMQVPFARLVELGVTSILHEIGMLKLPPQLYLKNAALSPSEKKQLYTHTILGYNIVKTAGFPLSVQLGVLEHHERANGSGYPRRISGDQIDFYAKIIAVACSYEAITSPRQFKEARTSFEGMIEILRNSSQQYDDEVIKNLLNCLSLFPIGSYVYLTNGTIAQVTNVNPADLKHPIVSIINGSINNIIPNVQTDEGANKILRVMNKKESDDVIKALNSQMQPQQQPVRLA